MTIIFPLLTLLFGCSTSVEEIPQFNPLPSLSNPSASATNSARRSSPKNNVKEFSIALVGEVRGELEPCGCPTLPYGGFPRRDRLLQELHSQETIFHLDAGELLLKGFYSNKGDDAQKRARLISQLSHKVGVDVWTVGPTDLMALGIQELQTVVGPPRISATWVDDNGKWLFEPFIVLEKENIRLAVIGLSEEPTDPQVQDQIQILETDVALRKVMPLLPQDVDLIVALGSIDDDKAVAISQSQPKIAALLTTRGASYEAPYHPRKDVNLPVIIEAPERGRYIHLLHLRLNGEASQPPIQALKEQQWRDHLLLKQQSSNSKKEMLTQQFNQEGAGRNLFFGELLPLNESYDGVSQMDSSLAQFSAQRLKDAEEKAKLPPTPAEPGYSAAGRCAQCHTKETAKWSFSQHSRAWETLILKGEHKNPECISCHSTGFGEPGGFGELTDSNVRKFKGVQCESCHGPLKGHPNDDRITPQIINEDSCLSCHDSANSPQFEYQLYMNKATCQSPR